MNYQILHEGMGWPVGTVVTAEVFGLSARDHLKLGSIRATNLPAVAGKELAETPKEESAAVDHLKRALKDLDAKLSAETARGDGMGSELKAARARVEELEFKELELTEQLQLLRDKYQELLSQSRGG